MSTTDTPAPTTSFARRHRKGLTISGIVAAGLVVASVGSYGVIRAIPAEFPLVYSERIADGVTEHPTHTAADTLAVFRTIGRIFAQLR